MMDGSLDGRVAISCGLNEKKLINDFEEPAGILLGLKVFGKFIYNEDNFSRFLVLQIESSLFLKIRKFETNRFLFYQEYYINIIFILFSQLNVK